MKTISKSNLSMTAHNGQVDVTVTWNRDKQLLDLYYDGVYQFDVTFSDYFQGIERAVNFINTYGPHHDRRELRSLYSWLIFVKTMI